MPRIVGVPTDAEIYEKFIAVQRDLNHPDLIVDHVYTTSLYCALLIRTDLISNEKLDELYHDYTKEFATDKPFKDSLKDFVENLIIESAQLSRVITAEKLNQQFEE